MPIYIYKCQVCNGLSEEIQTLGLDEPPFCCGKPMLKKPTCQAFVKIKGQGYPSRRKFHDGTAPYTSRTTKEWTPDNRVKFDRKG